MRKADGTRYCKSSLRNLFDALQRQLNWYSEDVVIATGKLQPADKIWTDLAYTGFRRAIDAAMKQCADLVPLKACLTAEL